MTFAVETKERLPDWTQETFERYRMQTLVQILERRFLAVEESLIEIQLSNTGVIGGDTFAPLVHTHGISEIVDFPEDNVVFNPTPGQISITGDVTLGDISDVDLTGIQNNWIIKWDAGNSRWIVDDIASAGNSLASLIDVTISSPVDGDILIRDGVSNQWVNTDPASLPYVQKAGDIMTGNLQFTDLLLLTFGDAATDYQIYYDGAEARHDSATAWRVRVGGDSSVVANLNGSVVLGYDGTETLRTGIGTAEVWDGDSWEDVVLDTRTLDVIGTANETTVDLAGPVDLSANRAWTIGIADDPIIPGVASVTIPAGTTAQEPTAVDGMLRYDTDTDALRVSIGAVWDDVQIGSEVSNAGIGEYTYESTTTSPPASGEVRFDNATITSATNMYVHETNADSVDVSAFLALLDDGAAVFLQGRDSREKWVAVELSSATDNGTDWTFGIANVVAGPTALVDGDPIDFLFSQAGGGGGGGALNDLTDVTISAAATGDTLYKSAGNWLNTARLSWDDAAGTLLVGNPSGQRIEILGDDLNPAIQAFDGAGASYENLYLNPLGGPNIIVGSPSHSGNFIVYNSAGAAGMTISTSANPSFRSTGSSWIMSIEDSSGNDLLTLRAGTSVTNWDWFTNGQNIVLRGEDGSSTLQNMITMNPDGEKILHYDGDTALRIIQNEYQFRSQTNSNDPTTGGAQLTFQRFQNSLGGNAGTIGFLNTSSYDIENQVHGGLVRIRGQESSVGTVRSLIEGDPDDDVALFDAGTEVARTLPAASGGWEVNNTLTGGGFERALTESDGFAFRAILAAQDSKTNSTTLTGLSGFSTTLAASTRYRFKLVLWVSSGTAGTNPGFKIRADYSGTQSSTEGHVLVHQSGSLRNALRGLPDITITTLYAGTTADEAMCVYEGFIETITTGTLEIQWAQDTAGGGTATSIEEGSSVEVWAA